MATAPVTRATLIERVARLANTSGYADTSQGGEVSQQVDLSLAKLHNFLAGLYEDYYTKVHRINVVTGQDTYGLPPRDFMKLRQVFYSDGSGNRWPLRRLELPEMTGPNSATGYTSAPTGYLMLGSNLILSPTPSSNAPHQIEIFYVPEYIPAAGDNDPIEFVVAFGWDEWVVYDAVCHIRMKAMMPVDDVAAERSRLEARMTHQAKQRNSGDPPRVADTGWRGTYPWGRFGQFAIR